MPTQQNHCFSPRWRRGCSFRAQKVQLKSETCRRDAQKTASWLTGGQSVLRPSVCGRGRSRIDEGRPTPSPALCLSWRAAADEDVGSSGGRQERSECAEQGGKSPRSLHPVHILDFLCSCPLKHTHTVQRVQTRQLFNCSRKRRRSSSREGQTVITYSLEFESFRFQLSRQHDLIIVRAEQTWGQINERSWI